MKHAFTKFGSEEMEEVENFLGFQFGCQIYNLSIFI
jgi:hypothetical protein